MAPPPGLFSMTTGWPKLSDSFCPYTRAMMSLPPPALKPTMMWIGRAGYFAGSSCAMAGRQRLAANATARSHLRRSFIDLLLLERRNMDMQHRRLAIIERCEAAVDRGGKLIRLGDAFAVRAERPRNGGKIPRLALTAGPQPRLKPISLRGDAIWIDPLHRRLHRLPSAIVEHNGEN